MTMLLAVPVVYAQSTVDQVLSQIEKNNVELAALRSRNEADKYGYKAERVLEDPEFGFDYLWSNPDVGPRKGFSFTQTLDFAVLFGSKGKLAVTKSELSDMQYAVERQRILLEARTTCMELIYCNAVEKELAKRINYAELVAEDCSRMLEQGESSRSEANEAKLSLVAVRGEYRRNAIEKESLLTELKRLNGGEPVDFSGMEYEEMKMLPADFDTWYLECAEESPVLAYVAKSVDVKEQEMKTEKIANAPKLTAGYMSELVKGSEFRGLTFGVSIPLWSVKNNVRQAKSEYEAARLQQEDAVNRYYTQMRQLYDKTSGLQTLVSECREAVDVAGESASLIETKYENGEISLLQCIVELQLYYSIMDQSLEAERDYQVSLARLEAYKL